MLFGVVSCRSIIIHLEPEKSIIWLPGSENQKLQEVQCIQPALFACLDFVGGSKLARGTTFGCQNQSGGIDFGRGTEIFVTVPELLMLAKSLHAVH